MTSWADIQKLASDLQRVQLSQSSKKLSEVNCIEVLQKLIASEQINVIYTRDGHSYVTKTHLETEVKNECIAAGGRAPLTDIAVALNIDFDHVEQTARRIVSHNEEFTLSNAELFATEYVHCLRNELRTLLEENGNMTIGSLCKHWDLSPELLQSLLIEKLDASNFQGVVDGDSIYTSSYLEGRQLVLRAVLIAITKVTPISNIQKRVGLTPKRFWIAFENLQARGEIPGTILGSRTSPACSYRPSMFDFLVNSCILNQFRQMDYLQNSTLKTLGVDAKPALENILGSKEMKNAVSLSSMFMKKELVDQCVQTVQEDVRSNGIAEVRLSLQPLNLPLDTADEDLIGNMTADSEKDLGFSEGFVFKSSIITDALRSIEQRLDTKAHQEVDKLEAEKLKQGGAKQPIKINDEVDDWGDNKKGGKGGKKSGKGGAKGGNKSSTPASTASGTTTIRVTEEELEAWILEEKAVPEEIVPVVVERLSQEATNVLREKVKEIQALQLVASTTNSKKSLAAIGEKCRELYDTLNTFEASTATFADPLGSDLRQYLLKTTGSELAMALLSYATGVEHPNQMKEKQREDTINALPEMVRKPISALFASLKGTDENALEIFHDAVHDCCVPSATSLTLKRLDKKKRSEFNIKITDDLREQLSTQSEPATVLLLSVLYILSRAGRPTTASGKFVSQLVAQIKDLCSDDMFAGLQSCQKGVVACIKNKDDQIAKDMLNEEISKLRDMVLQ